MHLQRAGASRRLWYHDEMQAELLTIGSELTSGVTVNTNAPYLARRLEACGITCRRHIAVSDERPLLLQSLRDALARCDFLVTTGGLGPTFDDITMAAIAEVTGRKLTTHADIASTIRRFYTRRHRRLQQAALRQALLPSEGVALPNPIGTAPGLWLRHRGTLIISLPGVPSEMRAIFERHVFPRLKHAVRGRAIESRMLRTVGLVELSIESILRRLRIPPQVDVGLYPHLRMVDVRLTATAPSARAARRTLDRLEAPLRDALGAALYGAEQETLEGVVGQQLARTHQTLAVAESCTGGLLTNLISDVPGSSRYLLGSVIAYANQVKTGQLGVPARLLVRHGAVSAPVAKAMADGARRLFRSDLAIAITGIAGPTGATKQKPVGLVYLALATEKQILARQCRFFGDRLSVKLQAAQVALDWLRRTLLREEKPPRRNSAGPRR